MHIHHVVNDKMSENEQKYDKKVAIIGGGPAGLTAAHKLSKDYGS